MIHVRITSLAPTGDALDIVVSHAQAHADFPQPGGCPALAGTVSGNATLVNEQADPRNCSSWWALSAFRRRGTRPSGSGPAEHIVRQ